MYSMRMSLVLALCNPRRHAPIMKRYIQSWNYDNQREPHVTRLRIFAFSVCESTLATRKQFFSEKSFIVIFYDVTFK